MGRLIRIIRSLLKHGTLAVFALLVLAPVIGLIAGAYGPDAAHPFAPLFALLEKTDASGDSVMRMAIGNSLVVSSLVALVCVCFAPPAGYALSRTTFPGRRIILGAFVSAVVAPITLLLVPTEIVLGTLGLKDTYAGLVLAELGLIMPLTAWLMKRAFDRLPDELVETARLEGASPSRIYWQVALPSVRGAVLAVIAVAFAVSWSEYLFATTLVSKARLFTVGADIVNAAKPTLSPWERFAPAALLAAWPAVALFLLVQRRFEDFLPLDALMPRPSGEE